MGISSLISLSSPLLVPVGASQPQPGTRSCWLSPRTPAFSGGTEGGDGWSDQCKILGTCEVESPWLTLSQPPNLSKGPSKPSGPLPRHLTSDGCGGAAGPPPIRPAWEDGLPDPQHSEK